MLNYKEFIEYYKTNNRFPNGIYNNPKKKLNDVQLKTKYKKYIQSEEKRNNRFKKQVKKANKFKEIKTDQKWENLKKEVWKRDESKCRLYKAFNIYEQLIADDLLQENKHLLQLDVAHIFSRGTYPELKYNLDNVILLTRLFHSRIDSYKHPLTGKSITKEERNNIWIKIVGIEKWNSLLNKINK